MANVMLSVMGHSAARGITLAQHRGFYKGRKMTLSPDRAAELVQPAGTGVLKWPVPVSTGSAGRRSTSTCATSVWSESTPLPI
ncbi:hypothetical protein QFZ57_004187 [Arthrobacter sp. B1I2]|nr:hypothetical protein [Arthrobacter sp. B1I2]